MFLTNYHESTNKIEFPFQDKNYLIFGQVLDGMGDISCTLKFAAHMHERLSVSIENIFIATNATEKQIACFNKKYQFKTVNFEQASRIVDVALQIIVPCTTQYEIYQHLLPSVNKIFLHEYGFSSDYSHPQEDKILKSLGLNEAKGEIGIFIDKKLCQKARLIEEGKRQDDEIKVSAFIRKYVLDDKNLKDFRLAHTLYVAYATEISSYQHFVLAIVGLNIHNDKDLVVVAPSLQPINRFLNRNFLEKLKESGIGRCDIKRFQEEFSEEKMLFEETEGKKLKILTGYFAHQTLKKLLLLSEKETLATGDQSLSENISANKSFIYEQRSHKKELGRSLKELDHKINPDKSFCSVKILTISSGNLFNSDQALNLFQHFKAQIEDKYRQVKAFNDKICQEKDCFPTIAKLIGESLSKKTIQVEDLRRKGPFKNPSQELKFEIPYLINLDQVISLAINKNSGYSNNTDLADSCFTCESISLEAYQVMRKKRI